MSIEIMSKAYMAKNDATVHGQTTLLQSQVTSLRDLELQMGQYRAKG